jgi:general L-amino acid transport system permease protein
MRNQKSPIAYVRTDMLDQQPAPRGEVGAVKWVRENLFSGWFNTILTLTSIFVIYSALSAFIPWAFGGVWNASSLAECREILDGRHAACWAVINERWEQIVYGTFFPSSEYWRTHVAFVLLLVAIAPVLFDTLPRKLFIVTAVYPFLMVWLIWGGTIWSPAMVAVGLVAIYFVAKFASNATGALVGILIAALVGLAWFFDPISIVLNIIGGFAGIFASGDITLLPDLGPEHLSARDIFPLHANIVSGLNSYIPIDFLHLQEIQSRELGGFVISMIIGVSGIALSLPIGIVLALGRQSNLPLLKGMCVGFIEFFRGVPLITLLFTASLLLNYFLPPKVTFDLTVRVIVMVTIFSSAYMAEVIRGGLAALPKGQYEAADALGLDYWQAQRLIIMPQALKISIPGIVNTFIGLFKDTTLVFFIGIFDMLAAAQSIRANSEWNGITWELYIFIGLIFWVCCFSMSQYSQWLERKLRTDHH